MLKILIFNFFQSLLHSLASGDQSLPVFPQPDSFKPQPVSGAIPQSLAADPRSSCHCSASEQNTSPPLLSVPEWKNNRERWRRTEYEKEQCMETDLNSLLKPMSKYNITDFWLKLTPKGRKCICWHGQWVTQCSLVGLCVSGFEK